ncbi:MAG: hypothetical protein JWS12_650 [Candidatus Saccharibacteria bacterium]|nr:hypothetical protein [Candidatus Saccharibacteria bacterium]
MTSAKKPEVFAFIDNQNLNLGIQKLGWKMDWRKFRRFLQERYGVTQAYMFIGHVPEYEDMYLQLHDAGYLIVLKPTQDMTKPHVDKPVDADNKDDKPEEKKPIKGNIDAELVLWAMKEFKNYQKAIIISGDGDFYCLAEYLDEQGKLGQILTPNWQYSQLLNQFEKYIVRLDKMKQQLQFRGSKPRPSVGKPTSNS